MGETSEAPALEKALGLAPTRLHGDGVGDGMGGAWLRGLKLEALNHSVLLLSQIVRPLSSQVWELAVIPSAPSPHLFG